MHHVDVQRGMGMEKKAIGAALRASLPVMAGYIVLGMGFGVLLAVGAFDVGYDLCRFYAVCCAGSYLWRSEPHYLRADDADDQCTAFLLRAQHAGQVLGCREEKALSDLCTDGRDLFAGVFPGA